MNFEKAVCSNGNGKSKPAHPTTEDLAAAAASVSGQPTVSPYEAILRNLLEEVAQQRLEELAGEAAEGISVRVTLEWRQ